LTAELVGASQYRDVAVLKITEQISTNCRNAVRALPLDLGSDENLSGLVSAGWIEKEADDAEVACVDVPRGRKRCLRIYAQSLRIANPPEEITLLGKVPTGSSGGALINEDGEVVGMVVEAGVLERADVAFASRLKHLNRTFWTFGIMPVSRQHGEVEMEDYTDKLSTLVSKEQELRDIIAAWESIVRRVDAMESELSELIWETSVTPQPGMKPSDYRPNFAFTAPLSGAKIPINFLIEFECKFKNHALFRPPIFDYKEYQAIVKQHHAVLEQEISFEQRDPEAPDSSGYITFLDQTTYGSASGFLSLNSATRDIANNCPKIWNSLHREFSRRDPEYVKRNIETNFFSTADASDPRPFKSTHFEALTAYVTAIYGTEDRDGVHRSPPITVALLAK
jgi:hypothetical protein